MSDPITGKTVRVPRQMVAEWDAVFEAARAEVAERYASDINDVTPRQIWTELIMTLTQRYLLGEEPMRSEGIEAKLDNNSDYLMAIADHLGVAQESMFFRKTTGTTETEQDDS